MTAREREVLELIRKNPTISYAEIASALGISRSTVAVYIASLTSQGEIMGKQFVLAENYVVCIGESAMDIYGFTGDATPEGASRIRVVSGGVARNIGENLARLGDSVKLLSVTGDDRFGEMIQRDCADAGIDTAGIFVRRGANTPAFLQLTGAGGEPLAAVHEGSPEVSVDIEYIKQKEHIIKGARGLVVCGIPVTAIEYLHDTFPDKRIYADMTTMSEEPGIQGCLGCFYSVQANKREAERVTGIRIRNDDTLNRAADILIRRGVHRVAITLGVDGAFYKDADGFSIRRRTTPISHVVNSTGAGDAFAAGYLHCLLQERSPVYAVDFAMACAVLALMAEGNINPNMSVALAEQTMQNYPAEG